MQVDPAQHAEYAKRHNRIWPELEDTLKAHGVKSYSIFLDSRSSQLFAYAEIVDVAQWQSIAQTDVCRRWWRFMSDIMPANPDGSPVSHELKEVFHIEQAK